MPEVSERERKEKRLARKPSLNPKNPDELKVVFRCTIEQKRKLVELAEYYKLTMTDVMLKAITTAHKAMVAKMEADSATGE